MKYSSVDSSYTSNVSDGRVSRKYGGDRVVEVGRASRQSIKSYTSIVLLLPFIVTSHALSTSFSSKVNTRSRPVVVEPVDTANGQRQQQAFSWTDEILCEDEDFAERDVLMDFQHLHQSLGSEVVNSDLQQQIENAATNPDDFLDTYVKDASKMEKIAMSSVPQQLPKPAVSALSSRPTSNRSTAKKYKPKMGDKSRPYGVTPEKEVQLGQAIQQGVALHITKTEFEAKHGRQITRQEWTDLSGLISSKELRKQVSLYRTAKQELVASNMGLVHAVVRNQRTMKGTYEEMVQEGSLGLLRAAELFDPSRGLRFSTYATIWIKGVLSNTHVKEYITLPQREKTKWNKIRTAHEEIVKTHNRQPNQEEIATATGMPVHEVIITTRRMSQSQHVLSLDYQYTTQSRSGDDGKGETLLENNKSLQADADLAERTQLHADVVAALANNLDAREARVMRLRYGLADGQTRSIQECADAMGLSKTRVQQLAKSCLKKLREAADAESLAEYLLTIT